MTSLNDYYGFQQTPFSRTIATADLFPAHGHQEIQGRLAFALQERLPLKSAKTPGRIATS